MDLAKKKKHIFLWGVCLRSFMAFFFFCVCVLKTYPFLFFLEK